MNVSPVFRGRNFKVKNDLCFVMMPLRDPFTSIFEKHIKPVAAGCGLTAVKADDIFSNKPIIDDIWASINQARLVIADLTDSNPNVFYELGIAHTLGKEVILTSWSPAKVPFDVGHVRHINYAYPSQVERFEELLKRTIKIVLKASKPRPTELKLRENEPGRIRPSPFVDPQAPGSWKIWAKEEAMRRYGLSPEIANRYADSALLSIEAEFGDIIQTTLRKKMREIDGEEARTVVLRRKERAYMSRAMNLLRRMQLSKTRRIKEDMFRRSLIRIGLTSLQARETVLKLYREGYIDVQADGLVRLVGP